MIAVSAALVAVAILLLVAGVLKLFVLVYASIATSVVAALLFGLGVFRGWSELFGGEAGAAASASAEVSALQQESGVEPATATANASAGHVAGGDSATAGSGSAASTVRPTEAPPARMLADGVPEDATVLIVPSRRSYHLASCRQLRTREHLELTYVDAVHEGYTACSSCLPETALAARNASGDRPDAPQPGTDVEVPSLPAEESGPPQPAGESTELATEPAAELAGPAEQGDRTATPADGTETEEARAGLVGGLPGSRRYHRLTCTVVEDAVQDGIELSTMALEEAQEQELIPCAVCTP